ncbi:hypothetical protein RFI_25024, partial [Reticulomyxa filosa]
MGSGSSIEQATQQVKTVAQDTFRSISRFAEDHLSEGYFDSGKKECQQCHRIKPSSQMKILKNCHHVICVQCLLAHVDADIEDIDKYPLLCPIVIAEEKSEETKESEHGQRNLYDDANETKEAQDQSTHSTSHDGDDNDNEKSSAGASSQMAIKKNTSVFTNHPTANKHEKEDVKHDLPTIEEAKLLFDH